MTPEEHNLRDTIRANIRIHVNHLGYRGVAEYDASAGTLRGRADIEDDMVTFQAELGATFEETAESLQRAFAQSVDDYLAWCAEDGVEPMPPKGVTP